jgi:HSP20 family protein
MATQDKSRQQASYMPSQSAQQGGGSGRQPAPQGREPQVGRDERSLAPRSGTYLGSQQAPSPFALMRRLSDDMDRIFESFGMGAMLGRGWPFAGAAFPQGSAFWTPDIEVFEDQGKLVVTADLPGMRKEDVQVDIQQDAIEISGERRRESSHDEGGRYVSERSYGTFHRMIRLPEGADTESASASFRDGSLRVEMPFNRRSLARRLEIGDGNAPQAQAQAQGKPQGASNSAQPNARNDDGAPTG